MTSAPSLAQVRAQVQSVREKFQKAHAIAISLPDLAAAPPMPTTLRIGSEDLPVFISSSVLALRERLVGLPAAGPPLVVLTDLPKAELGKDLLARFACRRVFSIDLWQLVKERFRATNVDPRLVKQYAWAARALLEAEPESGYRPVPSGFLDAETAWRHLFKTIVDNNRGELDPETLLLWALDDTPAEKLDALPGAVRTGLPDAVEASAGRAARIIFECAPRLGRRTVSVGLVTRVLFAPDAKGDERAAKARGKLESLLRLDDLDTDLARIWTDAAERVMKRRLASRRPESGEAVNAVLVDADALVRELGAADLAWRSTMLRASLDQRLAVFARELVAFLESGALEIPGALKAAAANVLGHALSVEKRKIGVDMAMQLAGWLAARRGSHGKMGPRSFVEAARKYQLEGGFVDWARYRLWDGDSSQPLAEAYARLARLADEARHEENREFGKFLAGWSSSGSHDRGVAGVEQVLDRWITPLARVHPVLFLVIDAMSMPVFRELERDLVWRGWVEVVTEEAPERATVIAALPTVTEVSRTSLLCGTIMSGKASKEKDGFSGHAGLRAACVSSAQPVLFHKGDLREAGAAGLSPEVVKAVADPGRRVVGVVINAVDDHLARGDQVRVPWTAQYIWPLEELLDIGRANGRIVVLASDHGHVLERDTVFRDVAGAERWRPADSAPEKDEVLLQGPRVAAKGRRLLAPWSERVRFGMKKNGYHGGATLQEVVLPFGVFALPDVAGQLAGWREVAPANPGWWQWQVETVAASEPEGQAKALEGKLSAPAPRQPLKGETGDLLAHIEPHPPRSAAIWIDRLFESKLFSEQRKQAARTALSDARIRTILDELDKRGGKLTAAALAEQLEMPQFRVGGVVSALRRILNVEGYDVLSFDDSSETIVLNRELLATQFGLQQR